MKKNYQLVLMLLFFVSYNSTFAQAIKEYRAKKDYDSQLYGYENIGQNEYWWADANSLGKNEELMNLGKDTEWLISPQYDDVSKRFSERLAAVELKGKVGFIDRQNRYIIPPRFEPIKHLEGFKYGMAAVKVGDKYGYINKLGEFVIEPIFEYAENFNEDYLAPVKLNNKYGAIDFKGDTVVGCSYPTKEIMKIVPVKSKEYRECVKLTEVRYEEGFYQAEIDALQAAERAANLTIRDSIYITPPASVAVVRADSLKGMMREESDTTWLITPRYDDIVEIEDGFFLLSSSDSLGVVDSYGRIIIPCKYNLIEYIPNVRLFAVGEKQPYGAYSSKIGIYNSMGAMLLPPALDELSYFEDGVAIASIYDVEFYIDVNGQIDDETLEMLLSSAPEEGEPNRGAYFLRMIAMRPRCADAHNNIALINLERGAEKTGIQRLRIANKLDPDNEIIESNFHQAKSERSDRRLDNVLKVLEVAATVVTVAALAYDTSNAISGNPTNVSGTFATSGSSYSSSGSSVNSSSASSSSSSNGQNYVMMYKKWEDRAKSNYDSIVLLGSSVKEGDKASGSAGQSMSSSNYLSMKSSYREAQRNMKDCRLKAKQCGITIPKSAWESNPISY